MNYIMPIELIDGFSTGHATDLFNPIGQLILDL